MHCHQSHRKQCGDQRGQLISWAQHDSKLFLRFNVRRGVRIRAGREGMSGPNDKVNHRLYQKFRMQRGDRLTGVPQQSILFRCSRSCLSMYTARLDCQWHQQIISTAWSQALGLISCVSMEHCRDHSTFKGWGYPWADAMSCHLGWYDPPFSAGQCSKLHCQVGLSR